MDADYVDQLVQRGLISDDVAARLTGSEASTNAQPQRQSRLDILRQGLDAAKDYLTPGYFRDTPSSPQADRALADPNARPGKIGPPSGPPTGMQIAGGLAGDMGLNALPIGKMSGAALAKWLAANGIPWKPAEIEALRKEFAASAGMPELPGRSASAVLGKMSQLGLRRQDHPNYVSASDFDSDPEKVSRTLELLGQGKTYQEISDELGVSPSSISRYAKNELDIKQQRRKLSDDPDAIAEYKDMASKGWSQSQIAQKTGKNIGTVSKQLAALRASGELPEYAPMGGARTPSMPQLKSQSGAAPDLEAGQDFAKALAAFMPQYK
jgi:CRP-like cAMP-binding protein